MGIMRRLVYTTLFTGVIGLGILSYVYDYQRKERKRTEGIVGPQEIKRYLTRVKEGEEEKIDSILAILRSPYDVYVEREAWDALGRIKRPKAYKKLLSFVESKSTDPNRDLDERQASAAGVLAKYNGRPTLNYFIKKLREDKTDYRETYRRKKVVAILVANNVPASDYKIYLTDMFDRELGRSGGFKCKNMIFAYALREINPDAAANFSREIRWSRKQYPFLIFDDDICYSQLLSILDGKLK